MAIHAHYHVALQGTAASRPTTPGYDLLYYATDTGQLSIYDTGAAAWVNIVAGSLSNPVTIGQGGTGQTTKTLGFDALSPNTSTGDLISHDGTNNIRVAVGSDYMVLKSGDSGATTLAWAYNNSYVTMFVDSVAAAYTTTGSYAAIFGTGGSTPTRMKLDLDGYHQARIHMHAKVASGIQSASCKVVDITNTVDLTGVCSFSSGTYANNSSSWTALNNSSRASDIVVEAQAVGNTGAPDVLTIDSITLELR